MVWRGRAVMEGFCGLVRVFWIWGFGGSGVEGSGVWCLGFWVIRVCGMVT